MLIQLLILLLIAGVCGALGQAIGGYSHGGCLVSIALGFIGALLGSWLAGALHLPELFAHTVAGMHFQVVWSIDGSALFVALLGLITRWRFLRSPSRLTIACVAYLVGGVLTPSRWFGSNSLSLWE